MKTQKITKKFFTKIAVFLLLLIVLGCRNEIDPVNSNNVEKIDAGYADLKTKKLSEINNPELNRHIIKI
jgi:hypothetical protein